MAGRKNVFLRYVKQEKREVENHKTEKTKGGGGSSPAKGKFDCGVCGCSTSFLFCYDNAGGIFGLIQNNNHDTEHFV